jgi:1-acyl-sn-glycerol-3-phosphate acyltransferase
MLKLNTLCYQLFSAFYIISYIIICGIIVPTVIIPISGIMRYIFNLQTKYSNSVFYVFLYMFRVKYKLYGNSLLDKGFILANHRSFTDSLYDPGVTNSAVCGRLAGYLILPMQFILGLIEKRTILINRNRDRNENFKNIINHLELPNNYYSNRILFFPEGTRKSYSSLERYECEKILKPGLLKSIYEYKKLPVQLLISSSKEDIINEKKLKVGFNKMIKTFISSPIYPKDYSSFNEFFTKICDEWYNSHISLYNLTNTTTKN